LFTPIEIGNMVVPNRIAMVPTDISSANADGSVNQRVITYHEEIAKGGCGFIIVGATTPDKATGRPTVTCLAADEDPLIPGLTHLAEAMHRHGAKCAVQIQHPGRQAAWPRKNLMSASDHVLDVPGSAGHEIIYAESIAQGKSVRAMTVEEIYALIEKFAEAAWRVQQAGFDAVELHAAHGYLIAQFMSPFVNKRHDRFGGSFINRMRFTMEIVNRIQMKCGRDFPLGIRYSGDEWIEGGRTLNESVKVAKLMEEMGLAYVDISAGIFESPGTVMDPMYYPEGWNTYTAEEVKKHVKIPVITSHSLRNPDYCEKILAEGKADIVGFSRQLIADAYWANKTKAGKKEEIRRCISCLVGCWQESLMIRRDMRCAINPAVGDERFIHLQPAKKVCKVAVVGGGPAGMEAARISALRGHKVDLPIVVTFEDVLRCKNTNCEYYPEERGEPVECGQDVLIWGDHFGAADAAEKLGHAGKKVTIVTENQDFAEWMEPCHRDVMMKRFACGNGEGLKSKTYAHPVTIIANSSVLEIKKDGTVVIVSSEFERSTVKVDTVVLAKVESNDSVYESLLEANLNVAKIGDAKKIRNVRGAVTDGANAALVIEEGVMLNANNGLISNLPTGVELS